MLEKFKDLHIAWRIVIVLAIIVAVTFIAIIVRGFGKMSAPAVPPEPTAASSPAPSQVPTKMPTSTLIPPPILPTPTLTPVPVIETVTAVPQTDADKIAELEAANALLQQQLEAATKAGEKEEASKEVTDLIAGFPEGLSALFSTDGSESRPYGLVTAPSNETWTIPMDPGELFPIDEDSGQIYFSTGYIWATFGKINDGGDVCRFAGPWGGSDGQANYTYFVYANNHKTDVGAFQAGLDHYPAGSVAVSLDKDNPQQLAENLLIAIGHTSGINDTVDPAPRVGVFNINAETCAVQYFEATFAGPVATWTTMSSGQLPFVADWAEGETVFNVLTVE